MKTNTAAEKLEAALVDLMHELGAEYVDISISKDGKDGRPHYFSIFARNGALPDATYRSGSGFGFNIAMTQALAEQEAA